MAVVALHGLPLWLHRSNALHCMGCHCIAGAVVVVALQRYIALHGLLLISHRMGLCCCCIAWVVVVVTLHGLLLY